MNNATFIAIVQRALELLWDGESPRTNEYRDNPEYNCHAVEYAVASVLGIKPITYDELSENEYAVALKVKIMSRFEDAKDEYGCVPSVASRYLRAKLGRTVSVREVQEYRKSVLTELLVEYQANIDAAKAKIKMLSLAAERWEERVGSPYICDNLRHVLGGYTTVIAIKDDIARYIGHKFCIVTWMTGDDNRSLSQWDSRVLYERRKMVATLIARYEAEAA